MLVTTSTQNLHDVLAFLHSDNCAVIKVNLDGTIRIGREASQTIDLHFSEDLRRPTHVLYQESTLFHGFFHC